MEPIAASSEDIRFGQYVVVTARWILVATGLFLALWVTDLDPGSPAVLDQLKIQFTVLIVLAIGNFYLTLQLLRQRETVATVAYAASAADLVVITVLIMAQGGFTSPLYIFYFPALLAISVAFPRIATLAYTAAVVAVYGLISAPQIGVTALAEQQTLFARALMFVAVAFCGQMYFTIEHDRRADAGRSRAQMASGLGPR